MTPGFIRCKASVSIKNSEICPNGGTYTVTISFAEKSFTTSKIFVYVPYTLTADDAPTVEAFYECSNSNTRNVSGVTYNNGGNVTVTVTNIKNTQKTIASNTNRLTLSENSTMVSAFNPSTITVGKLTLDEGDKTKDNATYSYTASTSVTSDTPDQLQCTVTAKSHGQDGKASDIAKGTSNNVTSGNAWIWTGATADDALIANFCSENHTTYGRKYNTLDEIKGADAVDTYDSSKSLATDYTTQLLVQGGKLKYPNSDVTGTYENCTGTRYYVRPLVFGGKAQIAKIAVSVSSGMDSNFNNENTRLYLAKKGESNVHVLNYFSELSTQPYGIGAADSATPSSGEWSCTINAQGAGWSLYGSEHDSAGDYYLVVEMTEAAGAIGSITISH